jgi:hypothetical protein
VAKASAKKKPIDDSEAALHPPSKHLHGSLGEEKKASNNLDQAQKDYAQHPKLAKFNSQGSEQP